MPHNIDWPTCEQCGVRHNPDHPHAATTHQYQAWFLKGSGRLPTYRDAMAHCPTTVQRLYMDLWEMFDIDWKPDNLAKMDWTPRIAEDGEGEG